MANYHRKSKSSAKKSASSAKAKSAAAEKKIEADNVSDVNADVNANEAAIQNDHDAEKPSLQKKTMIGVINSDLYSRLLRPAFISFDARRDDEPLRQLVEAIVSAISMNEAFEEYRVIDDICQRYLYYHESVSSSAKRSWDGVIAQGLCDYWRSQVFMMLIRYSHDIFSLLLPEEQPDKISSVTMMQSEFFDGVAALLDLSFGYTQNNTQNIPRLHDIDAFCHGVSFPWLGFKPENIFCISDKIPDCDKSFQHEFALAESAQTEIFNHELRQSVEELLFIDLLFTQYRKIYDELAAVCAPDDRLPDALRQMLGTRIRFDRTYQAAYDRFVSGNPFSGLLHRCSRLNTIRINCAMPLIKIVNKASSMHCGVYMFHFIG